MLAPEKPIVSAGLSLVLTAFLLLTLTSVPAEAGTITLVGAPSVGGSYYGMYCASCVGTSFTLSNIAYVNTIAVTLYSPIGTGFSTFDFSLLSSATTTVVASALTAPAGAVSTETINVNQTLVGGTYYLVGNVPGYAGTTVTPGNVDGWLLSNGAYNETDGTVENGVGSFVGGTWTVYNPGPGYYAPTFTVSGNPLTDVTGLPGGTTGLPAFLVSGPVGEINGTISGQGDAEYYAFNWAGGGFNASASIVGASAGASYLFSEGVFGGCNSTSATLNSGDGFASTISVPNLAPGQYCIGLDANSPNDPAFSIIFNTPVEGVPEPTTYWLLAVGIATIGVRLLTKWDAVRRRCSSARG
jgi:hypothetical protein